MVKKHLYLSLWQNAHNVVKTTNHAFEIYGWNYV